MKLGFLSCYRYVHLCPGMDEILPNRTPYIPQLFKVSCMRILQELMSTCI